MRFPKKARGVGLIDTTRGALGHWLEIDRSVISLYQIITPSAWNLSTRCQDQQPGPVEKAMIGAAVSNGDAPPELGRIIRSFDPCVSCATHIHSNGGPVKTVTVVP